MSQIMTTNVDDLVKKVETSKDVNVRISELFYRSFGRNDKKMKTPRILES